MIVRTEPRPLEVRKDQRCRESQVENGVGVYDFRGDAELDQASIATQVGYCAPLPSLKTALLHCSILSC